MTEFVGLTEPRLMALARQLAPLLRHGAMVYLEGDLGAGKTSFARGLIGALGSKERVKSPTYSLIEHYPLDGLEIGHLDLYRLAGAHELLDLGLDELVHGGPCILLIEWPEKGGEFLPPADLRVLFVGVGETRDVRIEAESPHGELILNELRFR